MNGIRDSIMKLGYIILDKVKAVPEKALFRIYQEEKIRWIMEQTDATEDIQELEMILGDDSIERFIQIMTSEIQLVEEMLKEKPWDLHPTEEQLRIMRRFEYKASELKFDRHTRDPREVKEFLEPSSNKKLT